MECIRIWENNTIEFIPVAGFVTVQCLTANRKCRVPYDLSTPGIAWICTNGNGSPQCKSCVSSVAGTLTRKLSAAQEPPSP